MVCLVFVFVFNLPSLSAFFQTPVPKRHHSFPVFYDRFLTLDATPSYSSLSLGSLSVLLPFKTQIRWSRMTDSVSIDSHWNSNLTMFSSSTHCPCCKMYTHSWMVGASYSCSCTYACTCTHAYAHALPPRGKAVWPFLLRATVFVYHSLWVDFSPPSWAAKHKK